MTLSICDYVRPRYSRSVRDAHIAPTSLYQWTREGTVKVFVLCEISTKNLGERKINAIRVDGLVAQHERVVPDDSWRSDGLIICGYIVLFAGLGIPQPTFAISSGRTRNPIWTQTWVFALKVRAWTTFGSTGWRLEYWAVSIRRDFVFKSGVNVVEILDTDVLSRVQGINFRSDSGLGAIRHVKRREREPIHRDGDGGP